MKWFYLAIFINNAKNTHKNRTEKEETRKKVCKKIQKENKFYERNMCTHSKRRKERKKES